MKEQIKKGIIIALSFAGTLGLIGIAYGAWINIEDVSNGQTLDASIINNLIANQNDLDSRISGINTTVSGLSIIPTGAVMAFNLASCPTGWIASDGTNGTRDLRGTFIRGLNGNVNSRDVARTLGSYQDDDFQAHNHIEGFDSSNQAPRYGKTSGLTATIIGWYGLNGTGYGAYTSTTGGTETRPKNVALLYCQKL